MMGPADAAEEMTDDDDAERDEPDRFDGR